jgi:hypothetical protein
MNFTSNWIVFIRFLEQLKAPKNYFEINWPLVAQGTVCSKQAQHNGDFPVIKSETYIKKIVKPCTQKRSMWEVRSRVKIRKVVSIMVFWKKGNLLLGLSDLYWNNLFLEIALCPKIRLFWHFEFVVWRKNYEPDAFKVHILWKGHKIVKKCPNFFSVWILRNCLHCAQCVILSEFISFSS